MSWASDKTGRLKEKGHKRRHFSLDKFTREGLEKVVNESEFVEDAVRPLIPQPDPAKARVALWKIGECLKQKIKEATERGTPTCQRIDLCRQKSR